MTFILDPVRVVISADAPRSCVVAVVPNVVPVRVVILAEVLLRLVTVPEVNVRFVPVSVVMLAEVLLRLVIVPDVPVIVVPESAVPVIVPETSNAVVGVVLRIPILPDTSIRILSTPPVRKVIGT